LIQHSFALRMPKNRRRFNGSKNRAQEIIEYFSPRCGGDSEFDVRSVNDLTGENVGDQAFHSPLAHKGFSNAEPRQFRYLAREEGGEYAERLPDAFNWAGLEERQKQLSDGESDEARFVLSDTSVVESSFSNDFLVEDRIGSCGAQKASQALLEILAHRRSLLFGLALANRFVNVMLPPAHLKSADPTSGSASTGIEYGSWILQPLVSLLRAKNGHGSFGRMYSLTFFLIPVGESFEDRTMSEDEISQMVNAGWSLAMAPLQAGVPRFDVCGPLSRYLSQLSPLDTASLLHSTGPPGSQCGHRRSPSLRQAIEALAFGVALATAWDPANCVTKRRIGDDVVTSLGSARVSTVVAVDTHLSKSKVKKRMKDGGPPGCLKRLMEMLTDDTRTPPCWNREEQLRYRLDRHFVDQDTYALGVLPQNRCLVVASVGEAQHGRRESALLQASSAAYMTIGAATAIGTMRAINHDLEKTGDLEPIKIAEIDDEIASSLHDIYDLDITREAYRQLYRRLRKRLGIARDYEILQNKMEALYRATSTFHGQKEERMLVVLTAAIVALSVLILIGTVVIASHGG
jgi:hypothetical protein